MNKGYALAFVIFVFLIAPLLIYCQHANLLNKNVNDEASKLPSVVQDTSASFKQKQPAHHSSGELTKIDNKNDFIYLNTIDGLFYAVSKNDGKIKWALEEEAVLKFTENYEK